MTGPLTAIPDAQVASRLAAELPGWSLRDGSIRRSIRTAGWRTTLMLVNAIGFLSEAAWHHPDLEIGFDRVAVRLSTHDVGGITERDFALAREIDRLVHWRPGAGSGLQGPPRRWLHGEER